MCAILLRIHFVAKSNLFVKNQNVPSAYTILVPGALVRPNGQPSGILTDRLQTALDFYSSGKGKRFLLSGDHGKANYDEVNAMKKWLLDRKVPERDIFTDHAGFDTYNSLIRARDIFEVKDLVFVSQEFHLERAIYIGKSLGLNISGLVADRQVYGGMPKFKLREVAAKMKAFYEVNIDKKPIFGGKKIPITDDSKKSYD